MWLRMAWTFAAAMLATGPALAYHEDDDAKERYYECGNAHKGKGKRGSKRKDDFHGYYIIHVPLHVEAPFEQREFRSPSAIAPRTYPKESREQRAGATDRQREILRRELVTEQELLELAKRELAQQEADDPGRDPSLLRPYKDNVQLHERNVAALQRELSRLRR